MPMFRQISILGPGLLGASLALAAKEQKLAETITTWSRRAETRAKCQQQNWCDSVFDTPQAAIQGADLIIICTPVATISKLLQQIEPNVAPDALITDVGSTKANICQNAEDSLNNSTQFIGSHPMAGSEKTGLENATAQLFNNATCIVTPNKNTPQTSIQKISNFWQKVGMRVEVTTPEIHDQIVAHISHLPHLLASSLCSYLATQDPNWKNLSGGGLRDTTRIASGDPQLWQQISEENRQQILHSITGFQAKLQDLKSALENNNTTALTQILQEGKDYRDCIQNHD